jgi:hypothetical protein
LFFWLINRELQLRNGIIKSEKEYSYSIDDFLYKNDKDNNKESSKKRRFTRKRFSRRSN